MSTTEFVSPKPDWRFGSRVTACVDLIFFGAGFLVYMGQFIDTDYEFFKVDDNAPLWILWTSLLLTGFFWGTVLGAAILLLVATKQGAEPKRALPSARIWRNVNIVFFTLLCIFSDYTDDAVVSSVSLILFRGIHIFIVCKFIEELEQKSITAPTVNVV